MTLSQAILWARIKWPWWRVNLRFGLCSSLILYHRFKHSRCRACGMIGKSNTQRCTRRRKRKLNLAFSTVLWLSVSKEASSKFRLQFRSLLSYFSSTVNKRGCSQAILSKALDCQNRQSKKLCRFWVTERNHFWKSLHLQREKLQARMLMKSTMIIWHLLARSTLRKAKSQWSASTNRERSTTKFQETAETTSIPFWSRSWKARCRCTLIRLLERLCHCFCSQSARLTWESAFLYSARDISSRMTTKLRS